jgi:release factor glutamine methyltransferase
LAETVSAGAAWTVGAAVAAGAARLAEAGCDSPRLDAELLLAEVLDSAHPGGRERIVLDRDVVLGAAQRRRYEALLERRVAREPVAYILGRRDFRYLTLTVDRRVLIPRPETELLVEVGLGLAPGLSVADVGTGSGAVALALASERPDLTVAGLDIDAGALAVAAENGRRLGLPVRFAVVDLLDAGRYDAVLANLPYVADDAALAPEIRDYEPARALFAGADGLELIRRLVKQAEGLELLALEIGPEQARAVSSLVLEAGFGTVEVRRDLAGLERVVIGRS